MNKPPPIVSYAPANETPRIARHADGSWRLICATCGAAGDVRHWSKVGAIAALPQPCAACSAS